MSAFEFLIKDHRNLTNILDKLMETSESDTSTRKELFQTVKKELVIHEEVEEKVLYPALKKFSEIKDLVLESYEEHHVIDTLLEEIQGLAAQNEVWKAKLKVLKENLEHHIHEEEDKLFPKAEKILAPQHLKTLAQEMLAMKNEKTSCLAENV